MARFDERATQPVRGPGDILRWKFGKKEDPARLWILDPGEPRVLSR
jgi:hypothetical protein